MHLRDQLQQSLGTAYTLEEELGGGGMSRVFVARDEALRRKVVVKVLPPELIAGVNVERFNREIALAAALQHPHIVPVHTAGELDGVPYYTMPFVDGESLRARITRVGPLPLTEAIGVLRDVAKALAYAHERGVVHRDIKPDNVLLSGGSATVTDFGIAKALAASQHEIRDSRPVTSGATLTALGTSIGTPAYMAPEQAAGDPSTDSRADLYSFGCLAYEVLAGRPPFVAKSPQKLLAAQMTETPVPISDLRPETPPALADVVMRCLAKDAADRPQSAADIVRVLETVTSGGGHPAMPAILLGGRGTLARALAIYAVAFLAVAVVAKASIVAVGLPDWVFPGALIIMALGLPVILVTGYAHRTARRAATRTPTFTPGGTPTTARGTMATLALKASPHLSWRRTALGGVWAVAAFAALVGGYMVLRALGVGPEGSLLASGVLAKGEKLLVDDFPNPAGDTTLGPVVTEAFRTALGQSRSVDVLQQTSMRDALQRMGRPANSRIDFTLAREIATRDGIRAVVDGRLLGIGGKYVVSAQLVSPQSGDVLATYSENANSAGDLLGAIDKLAKHVRERIGESLRSVQQTPPLEQVTTPSLDALRKYVDGMRLTSAGDFAGGIPLLQQAVALDTGFAMAWRRLGVVYGNGGMVERAQNAIARAYAHRDRLSDAERLLVIGTYYQNGAHQDWGKARSAYEQLLAIQPNNYAALNNLGNIYRFERALEKAEDTYERAREAGPATATEFMNLALAQFGNGRVVEAKRTVETMHATFPTNSQYYTVRADLFAAQQQYDSAAAEIDAVLPRFRAAANSAMVGQLTYDRADADRVHGRIADARRDDDEAWKQYASISPAIGTLRGAADAAHTIAWFFGDKAAAVRLMDSALARYPVDSLAPNNDGFSDVERVYSITGHPDRASAVLARWEASRKRISFGDDSLYRHTMRGDIALAEGRFADAIAEYRATLTVGCSICNLPPLGQAYDLAGKADSAIAVFSRYVTTPELGRGFSDGFFLAGTHKRLGELYEAKGDRERALSHYATFIELWRNADAALQPTVAEVRARMARLSRGEGKS